eukprot:TRINITY_DN4835_c0_g1::TRINITY_DN4835_c0_g1_i1::g.936::m.936 TRINITY_DN4835_c0_g1::TRINITY_DN4835_c0_g1_i1::g.936  ORF type:complete len:267 (-),score=-5.96 TRINITY_DN4835_c0_g1_i1:10-777(-)
MASILRSSSRFARPSRFLPAIVTSDATKCTSIFSQQQRAYGQMSERIMDRWHAWHCYWRSPQFHHLFNEDELIREYIRSFDRSSRCYIVRAYGQVFVKIYTTINDTAFYKYLSVVLPILIRKKTTVSLVTESLPFLAHRSKAPLLGIRMQWCGVPFVGPRNTIKVWMAEGVFTSRYRHAAQYNYSDFYITGYGTVGVKFRYTYGRPASYLGLLRRNPDLLMPQKKSKSKAQQPAQSTSPLLDETRSKQVYLTGRE